MPRQSRSREPRYLRLLKRRQRTSLWLERLAGAAVVGALLCFLDEQMTGAALAWWLGIGCLLLALVFVLVEAIDATLEHYWRIR